MEKRAKRQSVGMPKLDPPAKVEESGGSNLNSSFWYQNQNPKTEQPSLSYQVSPNTSQ
jgi:hypothetical protein